MKSKELMCCKRKVEQISQIEVQESKHNASLKLKIQVSISKNIILQVNFSKTAKTILLLVVETKQNDSIC